MSQFQQSRVLSLLVVCASLRGLHCQDDCGGSEAGTKPCVVAALQKRALAASAVDANTSDNTQPHVELNENAASLNASLGSAMMLVAAQSSGNFVFDTLKKELPSIDESLHTGIPNSISEPFDIDLTKTVCCVPGIWSGCWCHCDALGTVHVKQFEHANTLTINKLNNVVTTAKPDGNFNVTIVGDVSVDGLHIVGSVSGKAGACGAKLPVKGSFDVQATMHGTAILVGELVLTDKMCFKANHITFDVPNDNVFYQRHGFKVYGWQVVDPEGTFWDGALDRMPVEKIVASVTRNAQPQILHAINDLKLCFNPF